MPAQLDDPYTPQHFRRSGPQPYPTPNSPLPANVAPRLVTLRDRITPATIFPFNSPSQLPASLVSYLCDEFAREVERGDTYPMLDPMPLESFAPYWFGVFGTVMLAGDLDSGMGMLNGSPQEEPDWAKVCLGSFYTKPNYPGRSSHVCNAGFLVTDAARNKGVGRLLGEAYLDWAPKLGYSYSVFNLVYETNVASCRIWDSLGFKRIGRVPKCGNLRSHPDQLIDAIIYGRELGTEGEELATEERFDKIRYYLTHNTYPQGADRAEKSRLRSAATHYRLVPSPDPAADEPLLMLKDKEVVADANRQYEIARSVHLSLQHGGINKSTASIAERFHWIRIKETVSAVIRNCPECKDANGGRPFNLALNDTLEQGESSVTAIGLSQENMSAIREFLARPESEPAHAGHEAAVSTTSDLNQFEIISNRVSGVHDDLQPDTPSLAAGLQDVASQDLIQSLPLDPRLGVPPNS